MTWTPNLRSIKSSLWAFLPALPVECDPGTYGAGCEKKCACPKGVSCDHVTGECQRKCPLGRHGENCDQGRRIHAGHSFLPFSSCCVFSFCCAVLRQKSLLSEPAPDCPEGRFGSGCIHPCNCTGAPCDKVTGQCQCPAGTSGQHCESCESY